MNIRLMIYSVFMMILLPFSNAAPPAGQKGERRIANTVHNLSTRVTNPRGARSEVCRYCHTPHNSVGMKSLWARQDSTVAYKIYESSTLDAKPGQPNGTSKMCLSCHDGTLALSGNGKTIGSGLMNLGTDLSDDHPISFVYDDSLSQKDHQLRNPMQLPSSFKLDAKKQLQCTTCHNVHSNEFGHFLVSDDQNGSLCTSCHQMDNWSNSSHRNSSAPVKQNARNLPYPTVGQNACGICHATHNALGSQRLQLSRQEEGACLNCHNGTVAQTNIVKEIDKYSAHDPRDYIDLHDPVETVSGSKPHVECADCHNPHAVMTLDGSSQLDQIGNTLVRTRGVSISGSIIQNATSEYEVCIRCHGDNATPIAKRIGRIITSSNIRAEISTSAGSYHPIHRPVTESSSISLKSTMSDDATIKCTDCHNNDQGPGAGGSGPSGPHGSRFNFLLERNYITSDRVVESQDSYALCYKCHNRESILANQSFPLHKEHIVDHQSPCSACHDPHGVIKKTGNGGSQTHLINFNSSTVFSSASGVIEFRDDPNTPRKGSCALSCHGKNHEHATESY